VAISADTERKLLARSEGYCANPGCRADLFPYAHPEHIATIGELSHNIAQSKAGPRGDVPLPESERDAYDNILLLCSSCHTLVDKMKTADLYDEELVAEWKRQQEQRIKDAVDVPEYATREELVDRIAALMRENHEWWTTYGPESPAAEEPVSEAPRVWLREVRRVLIPNNWQIVRLAERNARHLTHDELNVLARFKIHAESFATKHLTGEADPYAPRFPSEMDDIFLP